MTARAQRRAIVYIAAAFATILVATYLPVVFAKQGLYIAALWPANGLALVFILRCKRSEVGFVWMAASVVVALFAGNVLAGNSALISTAFSAGNAVEIVTAYGVIRWAGWRRAESSGELQIWSFLKRIIVAAIVGPAFGATVGAFALTLLNGADVAVLWYQWWLPSALSMLVIAPAGLVLPRDVLARLRAGSLIRDLAIIMVLVVATTLPAFLTSRLTLMVLSALVIIGAAVRLKTIGAIFAVLATALLSLSLVSHPDVAGRFRGVFSPSELYALMQMYLVVQSLIALGIATLLEERSFLTAALEIERSEARRQADARLRLLMNIAHEIRTPLNVVQGCSNLISGAGPLTPEQGEMLKTSDRAAAQLQFLANDLLETSRIETGLLSFEPQELAPEPLLHEVAEHVLASLGRFEASIAIAVPAHVTLWADASRFRQIATNLISNAVKHGAAHGAVGVRIVGTSTGAQLQVTDHGPGFPSGFSQTAFVPFAGNGPTNATEAGVGLALVKQHVEMHGGSIDVVSTPYVETRVSVTFPDATSDRARAAIRRYRTNSAVSPDLVFAFASKN